jgi:tetratricopeptide (TPR) repeat protein
MKNEIRFKWYSLVVLFLFSACGSTSKISLESSADEQMAASQYQKALSLYEQRIAELEQSGQTVSGYLYEKAGKAALNAGDTVKCEQHFKLAVYHEQASPFIYYQLAVFYQTSGNISKEMMALEPLELKFPESEEAIVMRPRLFQLGLISDQPEILLKLWPSMPEMHNNELILTDYLRANQKVGLEDSCNKISLRILRLYPDNTVALEWQAKRYYNLAEDRYQREMKIYEANKTHRHYKKLLGELELSTEDMKQSLHYFSKLWKLNPDPVYATYLHNIYARFGDEKMAAFYRKRMK